MLHAHLTTMKTFS